MEILATVNSFGLIAVFISGLSLGLVIAGSLFAP
jgi:hypothetical protein